MNTYLALHFGDKQTLMDRLTFVAGARKEDRTYWLYPTRHDNGFIWSRRELDPIVIEELALGKPEQVHVSAGLTKPVLHLIPGGKKEN